MMENYDHKKIEKKWQDKWQEDNLYKVENKVSGKENFYTLVEFAYPSGNLHVGHWYAFSVPDMYARYKRMQGYNVLYPMGFDAFGLPAENAAIKLNKDPKVWTYEHMDHMRGQLRSMGASFDWSREVVTCDPEYYRWTQWMFTQFLKKDLVYRATTQVNWCPKDMTVLANEQVSEGKCDRCGSEVIQKDQDQWMFRITKYADRLIEDLDALDWPEHIKEAQRNWIGRSEGAEIDFKIKDSEEKITIFTTRADTIYGAFAVIIAPEHKLVESLKLKVENEENKKELDAYINKANKKSDLDRQTNKEKTGVELKGIKAINPINGEEVPVWIADFVLSKYGTGAVFADRHDERDFEFGTKYNLTMPKVIASDEECFTGEGILINSGEYNGMTTQEARPKIIEAVGGRVVKKYRLRDWGISRQRYWGVPIPIVYDTEGKAHAVGDEHLPWLLPKDVDHTPDGTAPLARSKELLERTEKIFGKGWKPEVETMDTFVDSSWYFYRYLDPKNENEFMNKDADKSWMPINTYFGGAEHTTMHLLYSRFWTKCLYDMGLVKDMEPYMVRRNRGLILGPDGNKMSKSKGNVIDPDEVVNLLGADTVRLYLAFMGPYGDGGNYPWNPNGVVGVRRFLERVWKLASENVILQRAASQGMQNPRALPSLRGLRRDTDFAYPASQKALHKAIKKITEDIEEYKFNTCISQMMILMNAWEKEPEIPKEDFEKFLQLLAPFAPHIAEELWQSFGNKNSIHQSDWPKWDKELIVDDEMKIVVQINGKTKTEIMVASDASEEEIKKLALNTEQVSKILTGKEPKRTIYVKGRLINIVS